LLMPAVDEQAWRTDVFTFSGMAENPTTTTENEKGATATKSLNGGNEHAGGAEDDRPRDKWETQEARFLDGCTCNAETGTRQHVFRRGESIQFELGIEMQVSVPHCWFVCTLYDMRGGQIALLIHEFEHGIECGERLIRMHIEGPNLRQGEYVASVELLPEFDENWSGPGRLPYLCHWDRSIYFKIDETYHGAIPRGLIALTSTCVVDERAPAPG
jgi:hypothetical protein